MNIFNLAFIDPCCKMSLAAIQVYKPMVSLKPPVGDQVCLYLLRMSIFEARQKPEMDHRLRKKERCKIYPSWAQ